MIVSIRSNLNRLRLINKGYSVVSCFTWIWLKIPKWLYSPDFMVWYKDVLRLFMKLVRRVIRYMLAVWDCISSFPWFVMVNVGFFIDSTKYFTIGQCPFCILLSFMLILRGTKLGCFGISFGVNVFQTGLFMLGMG